MLDGLIKNCEHNISHLKRSVALAITLNSASAKFRKWHDRSINSYLPFEEMVVGEWSQNCNCTFWNFKISLTCSVQITTKLLYLLPPVLGVKFYCFTNGTPYLLRVQFLTPFRRSPYLVLLGVKLTVVGHNLEKTKARKNWATGYQQQKYFSIILLIANRQIRPKKSKSLKIQLSSLEVLKTSKFWIIHRILLRQVWKLLYFGKEPIIQRTSKILTFGKKHYECKRRFNCNSILNNSNKINC